MSQPHDKTVFDPAPPASRFLVWLALLIVMTAVIFYNYAFLAGAMGEMVGGRGKVFGIGTASVGAGVIVVLEIFGGLFFLEARGVTTMFPVIHALPAAVRQRLGYVFIFQLVMFASIQAGLVWMSDLLATQEVTATRYGPMVHMSVEAQLAVAFAIPFLLILAPLSVDRIARILRGQPS